MCDEREAGGPWEDGSQESGFEYVGEGPGTGGQGDDGRGEPPRLPRWAPLAFAAGAAALIAVVAVLCTGPLAPGAAAGSRPSGSSAASGEESGPEAELIEAAVAAEGWQEGSSPFIARVEGEGVDVATAVWPSDGAALAIEVEPGDYTVSWVSAINADGSLYRVPEPASVSSGDPAAAPSFERVPADQVTQEDVDAVLEQVADAVAHGDETLSGDEGRDVVELAGGNAQKAPAVSAEEVADAVGAVEEAVPEEPAATSPAPSGGGSGQAHGPSSGAGGSSSGGAVSGSKPSGGSSGGSSSGSKPSGGSSSGSKPSGGSSSSQASGGSSGGSSSGSKPSDGGSSQGSGGSSSGSGSSGGSSGGAPSVPEQPAAEPEPEPEPPAHEHSWQAVYRTEPVYEEQEVWVPEYEYVRHERYRCNQCGFVANSGGELDDHFISSYLNGGICGTYTDISWTEKIDNGHSETQTVQTGTTQVLDHYACSCGATKAA